MSSRTLDYLMCKCLEVTLSESEYHPLVGKTKKYRYAKSADKFHEYSIADMREKSFTEREAKT